MSDEPKSGFTRRDVFRGAVVGAVAAGMPARSAEGDARPLGPGAVPIELTVNGKTERLTVEPRVTLVDALRERMALTGTKVVCGRGACGACTVLVDGEAMCSCLLLAAEMPGRRITTIEGLAADGRLSPIQEAFVAADALQCGFCTSGMVISCKALLDRTPRPSREQIREAVSGNLCRCGTYPHVFDAVERAAGIAPARASLTIETRRLAGGRLVSDARVDSAVAEVEEA
jgi:aerobic-type carbon monoxide dehydrogenase small subunit (CoxS/CutS family)